MATRGIFMYATYEERIVTLAKHLEDLYSFVLLACEAHGRNMEEACSVYNGVDMFLTSMGLDSRWSTGKLGIGECMS